MCRVGDFCRCANAEPARLQRLALGAFAQRQKPGLDAGGIIGGVEAAQAPARGEASIESPEAASAPGGTSEGTSEGTDPNVDVNASVNESGERDETGRYLSREAAGYRRRLREAETERDRLAARLDELQRGEVERLAAGAGLAAPEDVWQFGASLDTLRNDDGAIDSEVVSGLVADIVRDRPGLKAPVNGDLGIGKGNAASGGPAPKVGLSALLKGQ